MAYRQLDSDDRDRIEFLHSLGHSQAHIARHLGVHRSTISRELKRNSLKTRYDAWAAEKFTKERKQRPAYYLPRKKSRCKVRRFYRPPYESISMIEPESRWRSIDLRRRVGRKKKEWRAARRDACQFNRTQEDLRFSRGTHIEAWRRKKQSKRLRYFCPVSPFRALSFSKDYYYTYPRQRKRRIQTSFRKIAAAAWRSSAYHKTSLPYPNTQRPVKSIKPLSADPVIFEQAAPEPDFLLQNIHSLPAIIRPGIRKLVNRKVYPLPSRIISCAKSAEFLPDPSPP